MRINMIFVGVILSFGSAQNLASPIAIKCGLSSQMGAIPEIHFADIPEGINLNNYGSVGTLGVTATIKGQNRVAVFATSEPYKKVGDRLEFISSWPKISLPQYNFAEIRNLFGPLPEISCTVR